MNQAMAWYKGIFHWFRQAWNLVAAPSPEIREVGQRRQAQLLAALSILLAFASLLGVLGSLGATSTIGLSFYVQMPLIIASLVSYGLSRTRFYRTGTWILAVGIISLGFADALLSSKPVEAALIFITIGYLVILGLFSWVEILLFSLLGMTASMLLPMLSPSVTWAMAGTIFGQVFTYGLLGVGVVASRNAAERDRINEVLKTSEQLQQVSASLEQRVVERTRDIALAAEIGRRITAVRDLNSLLSQAVDLIRNRFDLYYTQIYLADPRSLNLTMRAGTGRIGEELLRQGHRLAIDLTSLNGTAALERRAVIVEDTTRSLIFRPHPLLPDTRSELAIPLISGDRVLGVLDLQSSTPGALTVDDLPAFETLAGQLSTALLNAELFDQVQRSLVDVETRSRKAVRQGWDTYLDGIQEKERLAYIYQAGITAPLSVPFFPTSDPRKLTSVIKVTGEPVGVLQMEGDSPWPGETVELVNSVTAQLAQQVENLRLLAQANRYRSEMEAALRRVTREEWEAYTAEAEDKALAFQYSGDQVTELDDSKNGHAAGLRLDIKVQDETIGQFGLQGVQDLSPEDQELVGAISDQLSAHLENMRLFSTAQRELDERRRTEQVLESQRRTLQAVLDNMPAGVFMVEAPSGRPILTNKRAEDFLGRGISPDAIGDDLNEVYQAYKAGTNEFYPPEEMPVVAGMFGQAKTISDMEVRRPDGSRVLLEVTGAPVIDNNGVIIASVVVFADITERHRLEDIILQERAQLAEALAAARMANWDFDLSTGEFVFNDRFYEFLGTTVEAEGGYRMPAQTFAAKFVHPDDAAIVGANVQAALVTEDPDYRYEGLSRQVLANGEVRDVIVRFSIQKDAEGRTIGLFGANQDVTEQRRAEATIAKRAAELSTVSRVSTTVATILNPDDMLQTVVDLTRSSFGLYHAHIYLLNDQGTQLVLAKGAGEVGRRMVAEGRVIPLDSERSLVARASRTRQGVIVNDVRQDPEFLPHALLPDTRSEMAVPLVVGDTILGVMDVQASEVNRFSQEDISIMTTLGAQVAVSLQNARSYARAQRQAEREALINAISERIQSTTSVEAALQVAVRELGRALGAQHTAIRLGLERKGNGQ